MSWAELWEWPYCVRIADGYVRGTESLASSGGSFERSMANKIYSRARMLHLREELRQGRRRLPAYTHVGVLGSHGWIEHAPPSLRAIADVGVPERNASYRMIILGFDVTPFRNAEAYFPDMEGWVYGAGLVRQKIRCSRQGFRDACRPLLESLRAEYLERHTAPSRVLAGLGVPIVFAGDQNVSRDA